MRKLILPACALLAASLFAVGASLAQVRMDFPFATSLSLDTVDIELSPLEEDQGDTAQIFDDEVIQQQNILSNLGTTCWVRMSHTLTWEDADGNRQTVAVAEKANTDAGWIVAPDGWSYLTTPLQPGSTAPLAENLYNPEGGLWDGRQIDVASCIEVQAVQYDNLEPDFTSEAPWGDTEPQQCLNSRKEAHIDE